MILVGLMEEEKTQRIINDLVEVELLKEDFFLIIKETLTRIGIANYKTKSLYQSCHILHKRGKYYIVHFKELFLLDGKLSTLSEVDIARRNATVKLLEKWELVKVVNPEAIQSPIMPVSQIKVLSSGEKKNWNLVPKYTIGKKR